MGIRQVMHVTVALDDEQVGLRRGPVMTKIERVITDLPARAIAQVAGCRPMIFLPTNTGAGPCGTCARSACVSGALAWSLLHLVVPLAAYYAIYVPPLHFGAKTGPRGRRAA